VNKNEFNAQRLTLAREKRGFTKVKLAMAASLTTRSITAYETGETIPTTETINALATVLGFPTLFFFAQKPELPAADAASFRSQKAMTAGQRDSALASSALAIDLIDWIDQRFSLPQCSLMDLRDYSPEAAASELRFQWGLGERPIQNTVHLLEAHGIRVFSLVENCRQVDAFSFWRGETPFVFLNTVKSGERGRFDAMHELGHLVLHRHGGPGGRVAEKEADDFAAAMLMPRADVMANAPRYPSVETLIGAKCRWIVAVSALNHRLHSLGLISDWHYRTLCIQISERGFRINEPKPCARETSQLLQKVFSALKDEGTSRSDVAKNLFISVADLDSLIFGLVPFSGTCGGNTEDGKRKSTAPLRLISSNKK
jgi:Zn-dependent peptidase ImmA (M78 family)/DNA-binding XRE family transcriptional regulator